jgi:hypothetical protein
MKKAIIASMLAITTAAFAGDFSVSGVYDYTAKEQGVRVGTSVAGLSLTATNIENHYNRFGVGKDFQLAKIGPVALSAGATVSYQDTLNGVNGYGLSVGAKATLPITKQIDLVASTERFAGQERVSQFNGNTGSIGLKVKF